MPDLPLTFLRDPNAPATALLAVAVGKFGIQNCLSWDPALLRKEIHEDFDVELTDLQADKLQAAIEIISSDVFPTSWQVFNVCIRLLNGEHADFDIFQPLEAELIAGAMPEVEYLATMDPDGMKFSDEVNAYVGLIFSDYGCSRAPDIFPTAIMPKCLGEDDMTEKNAALNELYKAKKEWLEKYLKRAELAYIE
jgi:hypothetical protein